MGPLTCKEARMTPSVPDWGLGRAFGVGETGAGWGLWPLSARQGANGPIGGGSGTRTSACTDISPTSLHSRNRYKNWCRVEIPLAVWKTGSAFGYQNGQLASGRPADRGLPRPAPAASEQPGLREAQIARCAEDEMVVHGNVQETPGVDQLARATLPAAATAEVSP